MYLLSRPLLNVCDATDKFGQRTLIKLYLYITATSAVKISVFLFYRRLTIKVSGPFLIATWVGIIFNLGYWIAFMLELSLICIPTEAFWMQFDPVWAATHHFSCGLERLSAPSSGVLSVVGDFYATMVPLLQIQSMNLSTRQKLAIYPVFGLGFVCV